MLLNRIAILYPDIDYPLTPSHTPIPAAPKRSRPTRSFSIKKTAAARPHSHGNRAAALQPQMCFI
jgi:hypothetical protein